MRRVIGFSCAKISRQQKFIVKSMLFLEKHHEIMSKDVNKPRR